jgi:UPF0755 protein
MTSRGRQRGRAAIVFAILGAVIVLLVAGGGGTLFYARAQLGAPADSHGTPVALDIASGEDVAAVASDLEARGLIRSSFWFSQYARLKNLGSDLHSGRFMVDSGMSAGTIISVLSAQPNGSRRKVSLAEGLTAEQMGHAIGAAGIGITQAEYLEQVRHGTFSAAFLAGKPAGFSVEGYLFPDTYEVPDRATAHDLIQLQLDNFGRQLAGVGVPASSAYQTVILASILEREAKFDADRPLVASVIENRLAASMDLQVDATVLYGLHLIGRDGDTVDTTVDTPFNSYLHPGLPPAPISNPGRKALEAAAHPSQTSNLYYVSDGCGHNHYAVTDQEFLAIKSQYVGKACPSGSPTPG